MRLRGNDQANDLMAWDGTLDADEILSVFNHTREEHAVFSVPQLLHQTGRNSLGGTDKLVVRLPLKHSGSAYEVCNAGSVVKKLTVSVSEQCELTVGSDTVAITKALQHVLLVPVLLAQPLVALLVH